MAREGSAMKHRDAAALASLALLFTATPSLAKRVICISPASPAGSHDYYLESAEGYYRTHPEAGDAIDDSGNLTACLNQLADGDKFILIAHGTEEGEFHWNGSIYRGFGPAPDQFHPPAGIANIQVTICVQACHSNEQPSAPLDKPLKQNIEDAFKEGSTATGWTGEVEYPCKMSVECDEAFDPDHGPTNPASQAEIDAKLAAARDCLQNDQTWADGAWDAQQTDAQAVIDNCAGAAGARITFTWCPAQQVQPGSGRGADIIIRFGCGVCALPGCGYGTYILLGPSTVPTVSHWGLATLALLTLIGGTLVIRRRTAVSIA